MGEKKEDKICVCVSNSTTLSWEERQRAVYVTPESMTKVTKKHPKITHEIKKSDRFEELDDGCLIKYKTDKGLDVSFRFKKISEHHLIYVEGRFFGRLGNQNDLEVLCSNSDEEAKARCLGLLEVYVKEGMGPWIFEDDWEERMYGR